MLEWLNMLNMPNIYNQKLGKSPLPWKKMEMIRHMDIKNQVVLILRTGYANYKGHHHNVKELFTTNTKFWF